MPQHSQKEAFSPSTCYVYLHQRMIPSCTLESSLPEIQGTMLFWQILSMSDYLMGDLKAYWNPICDTNLRNSKAYGNPIRDITQENSKEYRNPMGDITLEIPQCVNWKCFSCFCCIISLCLLLWICFLHVGFGHVLMGNLDLIMFGKAAPQRCTRSSSVTQSATYNSCPQGPWTFVLTRITRSHRRLTVWWCTDLVFGKEACIVPVLGRDCWSTSSRPCWGPGARADDVLKVLKMAPDSDYTVFLKRKLV